MPPRSGFPVFTSRSDARTAVLQGLLIAAIVVTALYVGKDVLLPLALAILLSFILTPPLLLLRRLRVPRGASVALVVTSAFLIILALGWAMSEQVKQLAADFPRYQSTLTEKIDRLRKSAVDAPVVREVTDAFKRLELEFANPKPDTSVGTQPAPPEVGEQKKPVPVEIHEAPPQPLDLFTRIAGTVLPPIVTASIVLLFVIFILLQREDLRDRLIRLLGISDLQRATSAINDAATRLSQYFLRQLIINSAFGVFITFGLWLIGVPTPIVWGILAMLMRFVPYVGSYIAATPPLLLAMVVEPGWNTFLLTGALYLVSEWTMGQVVEPLIYSHGTGLSPLAVVISTVFWTWLWGPLGLLLATPLTVVLVVLGRHLEGLEFLEVLLGDQPALTPAQRFYERLLTGDSAEATYQAELCLREGQELVSCLDEVALRALQLAEYDAERGALDQVHVELIEATAKEVMENIATFEPRHWFRKVLETAEDNEKSGLAGLEEKEESTLPILAPADLAPGWDEQGSVLCIGAQTPLDEAAAVMFAGLLQKHGLKARQINSEAISAADIVSLDASEAKLVCLSYLGVGARPAHIRYLVRRLRRILPSGCMILVGYWGQNAGAVKAFQATAEADAYATSFREAAEIAINAARKPPISSVTPLPLGRKRLRGQKPRQGVETKLRI